MLSLMPALRAFVERLVIGLLAVFNDALQAYISADFIPGVIKQQKRKQAPDASIPVFERMNAFEIKNKGGNLQQRVRFSLLLSLLE
jgi:hypothetical protein